MGIAQECMNVVSRMNKIDNGLINELCYKAHLDCIVDLKRSKFSLTSEDDRLD